MDQEGSNHGGIFGDASRIALLKVLRLYAIAYIAICAVLALALLFIL